MKEDFTERPAGSAESHATDVAISTHHVHLDSTPESRTWTSKNWTMRQLEVIVLVTPVSFDTDIFFRGNNLILLISVIPLYYSKTRHAVKLP